MTDRQFVPRCTICGISRGNSAGVRVYQYPLIRQMRIAGRDTSRCIASIGLCDTCVTEHGRVSPSYQRAQERLQAVPA